MGKREISYRESILNRFTDEYQPGSKHTANCKKTSQEIILQLRPIADFSTDEISEFLISKGYEIDFDGDIPVWLLVDAHIALSNLFES